MALSYVSRLSDGVTSQYDITFGYLRREHIFVFVDDLLVSYKWITASRVELNLIPNTGQTVTVRRLTDRTTRITSFADGQTLLAGDLNASDLQSFYILQELMEQIADQVLTGAIPINDAGSSYVTEQWINAQLESNAYSTQAYAALLQQILDEEVARAQAIADEASARAAQVAASALAEASARAADVLALEQADLAAGQRLTTLESSIEDPTTGLNAKVATLESATVDLENNKADASVTTAIQSEIDNPTTGLKARATALEDRTTAVENGKADLSAVQLLDGQVNDPTTGLDARATSLEQRTTAVENNKADGSVVTSIAQDLDTLEATVANPTTGLGSKASVTELNTAVAAEAGSRTSQINTANSRIDGVEASVTGVTQTQAADNQARVDDITNANAATAAAQADATSALNLVATEQSSRISEVSRLDATFAANSVRSLVENPDFNVDPVGTVGIPSGWAEWINGAASTVVQDPDLAPRQAVSMVSPAGEANRGIAQLVRGLRPNTWYRIRATVRRTAGSFRATGVYCSFLDGALAGAGSAKLSFGTMITNDGQSGYYPDGVITYEHRYQTGANVANVQLYAMAAWAGMAADNPEGCSLSWLNVEIVPEDAIGATAAEAKATADSNTQLISSETAARASALDSLEAQYRSEMARHNLIPGPYRIMTEAAWVADPKMVRLYNASLFGTGQQNPWTSTDALKFNSTAGDARLAFTPDLGTNFFNRPDRLGVVMEAGRSYAGKIDVQINATHTNVALFARGNDDGAIYTIVSGTPNGGRQTLNGTFTPPVTQKYSFELRVLSPSGQINNWIYRMQVTRLFTGEIAYDVPWIDDEADTTSEAAVKVLKDALATGTSSQARLFMGVNTANNEAYIEQYAGEGDGVWNGSKIKLQADEFEFDGNAVFNADVVTAAGMAVNFISQGTDPAPQPDGVMWFNSSKKSLYIRISGAWIEIGNTYLPDVGFRLGGTNSVQYEDGNSTSQTFAAVSATAAGGVGPYAYSWTQVAGSTARWYVPGGNKTSASLTVAILNATSGDNLCTWRCTVTDLGTGAKLTKDYGFNYYYL